MQQTIIFLKCWTRSQQLKKSFEFLQAVSNQLSVILLSLFSVGLPEWLSYLNYQRSFTYIPNTRKNCYHTEENREFWRIVVSSQIVPGLQAFKNNISTSVSVSLPTVKSLLKIHKNHQSLSIVSSRKIRDKFRKYCRTIC